MSASPDLMESALRKELESTGAKERIAAKRKKHHAKGGASPKDRKKRSKGSSRAAKAGLVLSVARADRCLRKCATTKRVSGGAAVYLAGVLEYLTAELLELAGDAAHSNNKSRITPRFITLAARNDAELSRLLDKTAIASGGVLPNVRQELLKKKGKKCKDD